MASSLLISALASLLSGAVYAYIGLRLSRRRVSAEAKPAQRLFSIWWFALAATTALTAVDVALYLTGNLPVWLYMTLSQLAVLLLVVALTGLLYYLVYLYTGSNRIVVPLVAYAVALFVLFQALLAWYGPPPALGDDGWTIQRVPKVELPPVAGLAFVVLFLGPQMAAAAAYALLYRKAQDRTQRYRIALVAGSIFIWFGSGILAAGANIQGRAWQVASLLLAITAGLAILLAYLPPRAWKARWGLRSIDDPGGA
ncbi:MAG: hypothetical protein QOG31_553 [Thermoplasmata archaeon]|jgi:hypothetical protein|nr:hypothetical protein [Thermoplasmata archaeon]